MAKKIKKLMVVLLAGLVLTPATATPAMAAPAEAGAAVAADNCNVFVPAKESTLSYIIVASAAVHVGPYASCYVFTHLSYGTDVVILARYRNSKGSLWYETDRGWIYADYVAG
ncbi:hypothetical protein [Micromonospora costi]|uniref:SH3 domain-containing protein n=1 Tax=Micromonospora costi TaxID=1530042 RepID=A0A3B0A9W5_9ACTN|nr:hypothetical protein [Micromonospora costi]RKN55966.1 hypothetical protein D7193_15380 [Micromonospora costi]